MARNIHFYIDAATDAFNAGFASKAAQKRALEDVSRAWEVIRREMNDRILAVASEKFPNAREIESVWLERSDWINSQGYYTNPSYPHEYRAAKHGEIFTAYGQREIAEQIVELRNAIKAADIAPAPVNETVKRVETIRKSIVEEMERRKAQYVEALEIGRLFNGLPVSVNAHWVHGHKGAVFLRHFFYLCGKLTPLNTIMAAADTLAREQEQS